MLYGWDVSTSIIGVAIFESFGDWMSADYCDLRKIEGFPIEKADRARDFINEQLSLWAIDSSGSNTHFLEDRLGNFSGGMTTMQTLMKLAAFNAVFTYMLHRADPRSLVVHLHPSTWKSVMKKDGLIIPKGSDKKALTLQFVESREQEFPSDLNRNGNPQPWMYDMADAYCIGRAGYLKHAAGKETGGPEKGP